MLFLHADQLVLVRFLIEANGNGRGGVLDSKNCSVLFLIDQRRLGILQLLFKVIILILVKLRFHLTIIVFQQVSLLRQNLNRYLNCLGEDS